MTIQSTETSTTKLETTWGMRCLTTVCEKCNAAYLLPEDQASQLMERCPRCYLAALTPLTPDEENPRFGFPPELVVPFSISGSEMEASLEQFARGIPYPPQDFASRNLRSRARRVFLPMWLVDVQAQAFWNAEAGFNYEVVSHREQFAGGGWTSQQVKEARVNWEPRLGRLERAYRNIPVPALDEYLQLQLQLGNFRLEEAAPYHGMALASTEGAAILRAPDRSPQDAWSEARAGIQTAAAEECRQAAAADHIRQFSWQPEFHGENWTLLLLPVLATVYFDDENVPQPVWINAQTGQISGKRRASPKRAIRTAGMWLGAGAALFILSLIMVSASVLLPVLAPISLIGFAAAILVGVGAAVPIFRVWSFNRRQSVT